MNLGGRDVRMVHVEFEDLVDDGLWSTSDGCCNSSGTSAGNWQDG